MRKKLPLGRATTPREVVVHDRRKRPRRDHPDPVRAETEPSTDVLLSVHRCYTINA